MNKMLDNQIIEEIRTLYTQDQVARQLFDWTASRSYDASETSIVRLTQVLRISRQDAVHLARDLERAGCGDLILGRRGGRSRFRWAYSCISLGKTAAGETDEIEEPFNPVPETEDEDNVPQHLTIPEAKALLAESLGLEPSQIAIEIRA